MKLKAWRERNCMTQEQAARRLGVSVTTVSRWESGGAVPRQGALVRIRWVTGGAVGAVDFVRQGDLPEGAA